MSIFNLKFSPSEFQEQYWKVLKIKAYNPETVVDIIGNSEGFDEHECGFTR